MSAHASRDSTLKNYESESKGGLRQKEKKKKLPQNKLTVTSPACPGLIPRPWLDQPDPRNMAALTQFISSAMRAFWPWLCCTCFFFRPETVTINKTTMGGRSGHRRDITPGQATLVTARFVLRQLLFFLFGRSPPFKVPAIFSR